MDGGSIMRDESAVYSDLCKVFKHETDIIKSILNTQDISVKSVVAELPFVRIVLKYVPREFYKEASVRADFSGGKITSIDIDFKTDEEDCE